MQSSKVIRFATKTGGKSEQVVKHRLHNLHFNLANYKPDEDAVYYIPSGTTLEFRFWIYDD